MDDWLLHMSEEQRMLASDTIDTVLYAVAQAAGPVIWPKYARLTLTRLPDRRSGATVTLRNGTLIVRTPLSNRRGRTFTEVSGPVIASQDPHNESEIVMIERTLEEWQSALGSEVTPTTTARVDEMRKAASLLITGAVRVLLPTAEFATLQSSRDLGHIVTVFARRHDGTQQHLRFVENATKRSEGSITPELAMEITRIMGTRFHAHAFEDRTRLQSRLWFHATPRYLTLQSPDAMTILRSISRLPAGASLIMPR